jgi:peptidoglycan/xylan/chitin deacetylase (PgdA/CDA1 family)
MPGFFNRNMPVPVLMYHHVSPHKGDMVSITPEVFEGQMKYLCDGGYRTLTLDELFAFTRGDLVLGERAVVVTFDDGWLDNYLYAFPIIRKYSIKTAIFIVTNWVDTSSEKASEKPSEVPRHDHSKSLISIGEAQKVVLNWDHAREMKQSGLVAFSSHTRSHIRCDTVAETELLDELGESRQVIERMLGTPCPYLCWPYGKYNAAARAVARQAGYKAVFTTRPGVTRPGSDPFEIPRIVMKDSVSWFKLRMVMYTNSVLSDFYLRVKKK